MAASVNTGSGLPRGHAGAALQDPSDYVRPPSPFTYDDATPYWEPERLPEAAQKMQLIEPHRTRGDCRARGD